jgi:hypothetical protein
MAITRAQVTSVEALASWMQTNAVPNIFKSVTFSSGVLTATDADDNTVLEIHGGTGSVNQGYFRAYRAENNYLGFALSSFPTHRSGTSTIQIIGCDNGFIIGCTIGIGYGDVNFAALFAKTSKDKPAIIFPSNPNETSPQQYTTALNHVAFGDSATMSTTTTFTPEAAQQTVLTPFATNAYVGDVSYTPNAYYMPMHSNYPSGFGKFYLGMDHYITNGYWAIKDNRASDD